MTDNMKKLCNELVASYNKYINDFWLNEMSKEEKGKEIRTMDFVLSSWGDAECSLLGKTPKEAIGEGFPDTIEFDDMICLFNAFAVEGSFELPDAICDLFFSAPEAAEEYILSVIDNMDLSINSDNDISDEENEMFCIFMQAVGVLNRIAPANAKERLFRIFSECSADNSPINEIVCEAMRKCGFVSEMTALLDNSDKIGEKEHYVMQELVHISGDENVFRCLKACLKKECDDIAMTVQIVSDCDDGRLIPLLRKIARNQLRALFEAGKSPYDESDEAHNFFLICNAITRLGGSIEDLLTLE